LPDGFASDGSRAPHWAEEAGLFSPRSALVRGATLFRMLADAFSFFVLCAPRLQVTVFRFVTEHTIEQKMVERATKVS
jgi:hypothetical protein